MTETVPTITPIPMADNFFFVFTDFSCASVPFNVLDTKSSTLIHTPLEETSSTTIPFQLSSKEINEVFLKIMSMDFYSYPTDFVIPDKYLSITETPTSTYKLSVTNGNLSNTVSWTTGGLAKSEYEKANQLWDLLMRIQSIIYNHPEYKSLPQSGVMCA